MCTAAITPSWRLVPAFELTACAVLSTDLHPLSSAGTGYGHGGHGEHGPVWDSRKAEMMQAAHDADLQRLLRRLAQLLYAALGGVGSSCTSPADPGTPPGWQRSGPRCAV